jgi:hypothetical protein
MSDATVGRSAAERLMFDKEAIARAVTLALYDEFPELVERYGERGRTKTLQDMHYNIEHLIPAVDLDDPQMFAKYAQWLDSVLRSRNVDTVYTRRCLELVAHEARARYDAPEADAIARIVGAGLATLAGQA